MTLSIRPDSGAHTASSASPIPGSTNDESPARSIASESNRVRNAPGLKLEIRSTKLNGLAGAPFASSTSAATEAVSFCESKLKTTTASTLPTTNAASFVPSELKKTLAWSPMMAWSATSDSVASKAWGVQEFAMAVGARARSAAPPPTAPWGCGAPIG
eukprot:scaffold161434_cov30-Tisochrysis_lutea.AAC.1